MTPPRVVILGAGPAGVGAAYRLRREHRADVIVLEKRPSVGGNAGSFELHGQRVDYGSHRLHPACHPAILDDIRSFLGSDLIERPRHGRIRLAERWIRFPLNPVDLFLHLDGSFARGVSRDFLTRMIPFRPEAGDTFASTLRARLGPTLCEHFYFPYAHKIWGVEAGQLSAMQAVRRVSANSPGKLLRKAFGAIPGVKPVGFRHYYYPRAGYGAISEAYVRQAEKSAATFLLGWEVTRLQAPDEDSQPWRVLATHSGEERAFAADYVFSTIPITVLARIVDPAPPARVSEAASRIRYRSMLLIYLTLEIDRFSEWDAHYFPGSEVPITRLSEPKNYSLAEDPPGLTTLCAELPCGPDDPWWSMSDRELGDEIVEQLKRAGLDLQVAPSQPRVAVRRLRYAYPIYTADYESAFCPLDRWTQELPRLLTYGRQGLFAHDNTHHALYMAYCAAKCLTPAGFDTVRWSRHREEFEKHVVED